MKPALMLTSPTSKDDLDELPDAKEDTDSQEMWDDLEWNSDDFANNLAELVRSASQPDAPRSNHGEGDSLDDAHTDADENPFLDNSRPVGKNKLLKTAISDPGPSNALSRDSSTEEILVALNSSQAYAVFPEYNQEDIAEADRVERDLIHEGSAEPEGPPATQITSGTSTTTSPRTSKTSFTSGTSTSTSPRTSRTSFTSETSTTTSPRTSRTSFTSLNSLQSDGSAVKLGKRRARDGDEPVPEPKPSKFSDTGAGVSRFALPTSKSDPGPRRAKKGCITAPQEPEPPGIVFIAHNSRVQQWFDQLQISWGVQVELSRGVSKERWSWEDITPDKLKRLQGPNADSVPHVTSVMLPEKFSKPDYTNKSMWEELDREQAAILENESRGLGMKGDWHGQRNWYGGRIQQVVRLQQSGSTPPSFKLTLCKMQMLRSHRIARYLGSRRVLQINTSDTFVGTDMKKFLCQKLVLCGRVYRPFAVKEGKVYAVEVDEDYHRSPRDEEGDQYRCSLTHLVAWYNPLHLNKNQPVSKWATRFDLGLSTSIPVIHFVSQLIFIIDDEYAPHPPGSKVPTEKTYTDGCGYMNATALRIIQKALELPFLPTAVQGRIFGSKGLWTLSPSPEHQQLDSDAGPPQIWIRKSQQKIKLVFDEKLALASGEMDDVHQAHFIFDLVAVSRVTMNAHLSKHTIVNLHHNGVPLPVLERLMQDNVEREMKPLSPDEDPNAMQMLHYAVNNATNVSTTRLLHYVTGTQRALGLVGRWEKDDDEDGFETDDMAQSSLPSAGARCYPGGKPMSIAESVLRLLKAGFTLDEEILDEDLRTVKNNILNSMLNKMRLPLASAAEAFLVPDPSGKLRQGEIHFRSSSPFENPVNEYEPQQILGSCLIYRNPARLPSDMLKVTAVDVPELHKYTDVIIVPNDGPCSLPSILAGGDVDGDTAVCIWDRAIVEPFHNPDVVRMPEGFLDENFQAENDILTVDTLHRELYATDPKDWSVALQRHMLTGLVQSKVGIYSNFHEVAMYVHGYADPRTLRVAHMFNIILDSRKTGHIVKPDVYQRDSKNFNLELPGSMTSDDPPLTNRHPNAARDPALGPFVLVSLANAAKKLNDNFQRIFESVRLARQNQRRRSGLKDGYRDPDIVKAWDSIAASNYFRDEVPVVKRFVDLKRIAWGGLWPKSPSKLVATTKAKKKESKALSTAQLRTLCVDFGLGPPSDQTPRLRELGQLDKALAAYAYILWPRFAFQVAFTRLAAIKAEACGTSPTIEAFDSLMKIPSRAMRMLAQQSEE